MRWAAATNNKKKLVELQRIMHSFGVEVISLSSLNIDIDVEETGKTFAENALIKAKAIYVLVNLPCIADDSGLCVDALNGEPGVYSARYAGEHGDDNANNQKLLHSLQSVSQEKRTARFVSAVAVVFSSEEHKIFEGMCEGVIGTKAKGDSGFGYDPLFYVNGISFAEMKDEEKDSISHRAKALQQLKKYLEENNYEEKGQIC